MKDRTQIVTKFRFPGKISKMGENKIIWIPKEFTNDPRLKALEKKSLIIQLDDEI